MEFVGKVEYYRLVMLKGSINKKQLSELELLIGKKRYEVFPQFLFLMGISVGLFLNLAANIIYDSYVKQNKLVEVAVLFITAIALLLIVRWIYVFYVRPINRAEKLLKALKGGKS